MHPTDTLLSLSQARIARAAAAGPRKATQPTALTDRQHLAQREQGIGVVTGVRYDGTNLIAEIVLNETGQSLFQKLEAPSRRPPIDFGADDPRASHLKALARADGVLAQRIDQL